MIFTVHLVRVNRFIKRMRNREFDIMSTVICCYSVVEIQAALDITVTSTVLHLCRLQSLYKDG